MFVTWDEAGGYWDCGHIQSIDFFGDGPRMPILILSPYSTGGKIYHNYGDHVSLLKFIERNWALQPLTNRSRDNLPEPCHIRGTTSMCRPTAPRLPTCSMRLRLQQAGYAVLYRVTEQRSKSRDGADRTNGSVGTIALFCA